MSKNRRIILVGATFGVLILSLALVNHFASAIEPGKLMQINPCAAKANNPCAVKALNPCAAKALNPCAAKTLNPCGANNPAWSQTSKSPNPVERFPDITAKFGAPTALDSTAGGVAIWKCEALRDGRMDQGIWHRIEMRDELVEHKSPAPHFDFLYTEFPLVIPPERVTEILALSKSVTYDPLKYVLTARCHFMEANVATTWLAMQIATGRMTLAPGERAKAYSDAIMGTAGNPKAYAKKVADLRAYINKDLKAAGINGNDCRYWGLLKDK
jgi:hypothetical protein